MELFEEIETTLRVGTTESNVTLLPDVCKDTAVAVLPALSLIAEISKATAP